MSKAERRQEFHLPQASHNNTFSGAILNIPQAAVGSVLALPAMAVRG